MKQSYDSSTTSKELVLYFIVTLLLLIQIYEYVGNFYSNNSDSNLKSQVIQEVRADLPELISKQIDQQIHELVMDKIKLNGKVLSAVDNSAEPMIFKVGKTIIRQKEFKQKFEQFKKRPEIVKLPHTEQKTKFTEQLHRHHAILEDSQESGLHKRPEFLEKLEDFEFKVFLTELLRQQVKPIGIEDIKAYYATNKSLFETDEVFSFEVMESPKLEPLQSINSVKKFAASSTPKRSFSNQSESSTPIQFVKALRTISSGQLSAILPLQGRYYLLHKVSDSSKTHSSIEQVAPFIQNTLTFQRIRTLLSKLSNALKFEFDVELKSDQTYEVKGSSVNQKFLNLSKTVLPKEFFSKAEQGQYELRDLAMEFEILFRKFRQSPSYFSKALIKEIEYKTDAYREQLVIEFKRQEILRQAVVSEEEIRGYYELHKGKFVQSVGRWVSHIFIADKSKALKILNLALDDPSGFGLLAQEHSENVKTKIHGGDMRYLDKNDVTPQMHQLAETLKEGEVHPELVSGVGGIGYHILRYVKNVPNRIASFEEVENNIRRSMTIEKQNQLLTLFVNEVIKKYPAKIDNTLLAQL